MRKLTIRRTKSFVACLCKMKIYIEDPLAPELQINNLPCRKIGELKNGEEKTFFIDNRELKVFVTAGKLSKGFCNDFYQLPHGESDIYLSGKNHYNPLTGNAFRFEGPVNEDVLKNRRRGIKKGIIFLIAAFFIGFIIGLIANLAPFFNKKTEPAEFRSDGMILTLTNEFSKKSADGFTFCYTSPKTVVLALKESFDMAEGFKDISLEEYGKLVLVNNKYDSTVRLKQDNGLTYFEYLHTDSETNECYSYFSVLYKSSDAFWIVQFAALEEDAGEYRPQFIDWAKSVKFSN